MAGISPAVNTSVASALQHRASVYYIRKGLDKLKANLFFTNVADPIIHPSANGRTGQLYRFDIASGNTNPAVESVIGNAVPMSSNTIVYTLEEYNDFTSTSALYDDTDISQTVTEMVEFMSYRAALTNDNVIKAEFDSVSAAQVSPIGAYFSNADIRLNVARMAGVNVQPREGGFMAIIHPYCAYDLMSDNTAGGFIDISKYAQPGALLNNELGKIHNCRLMQSTNVTNSGSAPSVVYSNYIVGKGAVATVGLAGSGPTPPSNPDNMNFKLNVSKSSRDGSAYDPAGTLGTFVAYRFVTAAKNLGSDQTRFRRVDADTSVV